jgi:hypothetical protein
VGVGDASIVAVAAGTSPGVVASGGPPGEESASGQSFHLQEFIPRQEDLPHRSQVPRVAGNRAVQDR